MSATNRKYAFNAIRFALVIGGIIFVGGSIHALLTIPPAPPESDGFATGMAYLVGGVILVVSLGVTGLGFVLPAVLGTDDPLGFNHYQRWALKLSGIVLIGGFLANIIVAATIGLETGLILWFGTIFIGVIGVSVTLVWRLGGLVKHWIGRIRNGAS